MPLDIIIADEQDYSTGNPINPIQEWQFSPDSPIIINHIIGDSGPNTLNLDIIIKDYLELFSDQYSDYYIQTATITSPGTNYFSFSGDIYNAPGSGYLLTSNNLETSMSIDVVNLNLLETETYQSIIYFIVKGVNDAGILETIDQVKIKIILNIIEEEDIYFSPQNLIFNHAIDNSLPTSKTINVLSGDEFEFKIKDCFNVTSPQITATNNVNGDNIYTISGSTTLTITPNIAIEDEAIGVNNYAMYFSNQFTTEQGNITLNLFDEPFIEIDPESLEFFAIKNIEEATPQTLNINCSGDYVITYPSFIIPNTTSGSGFFSEEIGPVHSNNMFPAIYIDNIIVEFNNLEYLIPVKYTVAEKVVLGLDVQNVNFTDDYNTISQFFNENYYRLLLKFKANLYSYRFNFESLAEINYKLSFFNNRVSEFIGARVKNLMHELISLKDINLNTLANVSLEDNTFFVRKLYKPVSLELDLEFYNTQTDTNDDVFSYQNILFIAGRKPENSFLNTAILSYYNHPIRVTPGSEQIISFYKNQSHTIRVYKNNTYEMEYNHEVSEGCTYCLKHKFANYREGDVVEFRFYKNIDGDVDLDTWYNESENYIAQQFYVFPERPQSHHILWENEHNTISSLEFTGSITFESSKEFTDAKYYANFLETIRKNKISKNQSVTINTGPILKNNAKLIDCLTDAKRAWIVFPDNKEAIALVPVTDKLITSDSDQFLYSYDVEFKINFNNDHKIYQ